MKRKLQIILFFLSVCLLSLQGKAQTYEIQIDSIVGIPDTVYNGQEVTFFMMISMNSPLFYQGDFFVELEYGGQFYVADTTLASNAFIGSNAPNTIQATFVFGTQNNLSIGDNVVVVWPRIGDGVSPAQTVVNPQTVDVVVVEPTSVIDQRQQSAPLLYPNPAHDWIYFTNADGWKNIEVRNAFGEVVVATFSAKRMHVANLPAGVYFLQAESERREHVFCKFLVVR